MKISKGLIFSGIGTILGGLIGAIFDEMALREDVAEEVEAQLSEKLKGTDKKEV